MYEELNLILHVLRLREKAIAFDERERMPQEFPYIIPVVEHDS